MGCVGTDIRACNIITVADVLALEPHQQDSLLSMPIDYQPYSGRVSLRETIASTYSDTVGFNNVLITVGVQEGIFALFNVLLNAGDHIVVQTTCYRLLNQIVTSLGCHVDEWAMNDNATWDFDELQSLVTEKTRLIIVNTPHNPTAFIHFITSIDGEEYALMAFNEQQILIAPGSKFGKYPAWAPIGFGNPIFKRDIERFE